MTHHRTLAAQAALASLPAKIQDRLTGGPCQPEPGAITVLAEFWSAWQAESKARTAPSEALFRQISSSESRLGTLLRSLQKYAPDVPTFAARPVRSMFYRQRGQTHAMVEGVQGEKVVTADPDSASATCTAISACAAWPQEWRTIWPALRHNPRRKLSTVRRYFRSIDRCAALIAELGCPATFGFSLADRIETALRSSGTTSITIGNYIESLIQLGKAGGIDKPNLDAMRYVAERARARAASAEKRKESRIRQWDEDGGFVALAVRIGELGDTLRTAPAHSAPAHRLRTQIALIALSLNKPARKGDSHAWRLGVELERTEAGDWHLGWRQEKTSHETGAGLLWPEVGLTLDALILAGRPSHQAHARYLKLTGCNWLTLTPEPPGRNWPTTLLKEATGLPSHDFRTIAADLLRRHDPATAASILSAHLGHRSREATQAYRALAEDDSAVRLWQGIREVITAKGHVPSAQSKRGGSDA